MVLSGPLRQHLRPELNNKQQHIQFNEGKAVNRLVLGGWLRD